MMMRKKQIAAIVIAVWLMIVALFMLWIRLYDLDIFFVGGFIGFLAVVVLLEPRYSQPGCLRYKNYLLVAGTLIFIGIVGRTMIELLGYVISVAI
jgi:hypothetical protein